MRYEFGIAASIMAMLYCFQIVSKGKSWLFWEFLIFLFLCVLVFFIFFTGWHLVGRFVRGNDDKFFVAEELWLSFFFGFLGVPVCIFVLLIINFLVG